VTKSASEGPLRSEGAGNEAREGQERSAIGSHIGTLNEKPLHAALKSWYSRPGDQLEVRVDNFVIDIVRGEQLIEIQTRHLYAIKRKLTVLVEAHPVRLVLPLAQEKWILRVAEDGTSVLGRRRSPRRRSIEYLFDELVSLPRLLLHPNFSLEVLLVQEEEVRVRDDSVNWRRRGWASSERRLLDVLGQRIFERPADLLALLPSGLPDAFTPVDLARATGQPAWLARKMTYCLREMRVLEAVGKRGRSNLFGRVT